MTREDINNIIQTLCPNNDDFEKPIISPAYLKTELEALAIEQEPCGDVISRQIISDYVQSHIQEINTGYGDLNKHTNEILRMIVNYIEKMEPVTPKQKIGRWIYTGDYITDGMLKCSECGFEHDVSERFSFCPNCGARMESEDDNT